MGRDGDLNGYFVWLISQVDNDVGELRTDYLGVLEMMFEREYSYDYYMNANRESDGYHLRERYFGDSDEIDYKPMSILEVLVALFVRYSDNVITEPGDPSIAPELFWDCLEMNGLLDEDADIVEILDDICNERISIFSVPECDKWYDMWYVTGKYCIEKYEIE